LFEQLRHQGEDTIIGTGVRQMNSRFKIIMTATPIKNRLPDAPGHPARPNGTPLHSTQLAAPLREPSFVTPRN
jgi:hypothetical protein